MYLNITEESHFLLRQFYFLRMVGLVVQCLPESALRCILPEPESHAHRKETLMHCLTISPVEAAWAGSNSLTILSGSGQILRLEREANLIHTRPYSSLFRCHLSRMVAVRKAGCYIPTLKQILTLGNWRPGN